MADIGTEYAGGVLKIAASLTGKIFGVATTAIDVVKSVAEAYKQLQVDDVLASVKLLRYPGVHLEKVAIMKLALFQSFCCNPFINSKN